MEEAESGVGQSQQGDPENCAMLRWEKRSSLRFVATALPLGYLF